MPQNNRLIASIANTSWNDATRTFEGVLVTAAPVRQRDGTLEIIDVAAIDAQALVGLPLLDSHRTQSIEDQHGVIVAARHDAGKLFITAHVDNERTAGRIKSGVLKSLSVGYRREAVVSESIHPKSRVRTQTVRVTPLEASLVVIPADPSAQIRKDNPMPKQLKAGAGDDPATETVQEYIERMAQRGVKVTLPGANISETLEEYRQRAHTPENDNTVAETRAEIRDIAKRAGLPAAWADAQIDADATPEEARAAAFDAMQERSNTAPRVRTITPGPSPEQTRDARSEALYCRAGGAKPSDAARPFMGYRVMDHLRDIMEARGERTRGLSDYDVLTRALGTSDLPELLTGVGARTLQSKYQVAQSPLVALAKKTALTDFRENARLRAGEFGSLEPLSEHGEIKHASRTDSKNTVQLNTFARRIDYTGKAILNDDLSALTDAAEQFGVAAAARDADELVAVLNTNPQMDDGENLFSAAHNNTVIYDTIRVQSISDIRLSMRSIVGLDGVTRLNIAPKYLVVSSELETSAEKFLAQYQAQHFEETNPFQSKLTLMVEPRLGAYEWFVFADPALAPVLELAHLSGREGPQVETQQAWDTWGVSFRCIHHVGAAAIGWRGAYRVESGQDDSNSAE